MGLSRPLGAVLKIVFIASLCTGEGNGVAIAIFSALIGAFLEHQEGARLCIRLGGRAPAMRFLYSGKHCLEWAVGGWFQYINAPISNSYESLKFICAALKHDMHAQLNSRWASHAIIAWSACSFYTSPDPLIKTLGILHIPVECYVLILHMLDSSRRPVFITGRATRQWRHVSSGGWRPY